MSDPKDKNNPSRKIIKWIENGLVLLMCSASIRKEYEEKILEKTPLPNFQRQESIKFLQISLERGQYGRKYVNPPIIIPNDPRDNIFFDNPNCVFADYLITLNTKHFINNNIQQDLVSLGSPLKILNPKEFVVCMPFNS